MIIFVAGGFCFAVEPVLLARLVGFELTTIVIKFCLPPGQRAALFLVSRFHLGGFLFGPRQ